VSGARYFSRPLVALTHGYTVNPCLARPQTSFWRAESARRCELPRYRPLERFADPDTGKKDGEVAKHREAEVATRKRLKRLRKCVIRNANAGPPAAKRSAQATASPRRPQNPAPGLDRRRHRDCFPAFRSGAVTHNACSSYLCRHAYCGDATWLHAPVAVLPPPAKDQPVLNRMAHAAETHRIPPVRTLP
jgi:hypothetical protein